MTREEIALAVAVHLGAPGHNDKEDCTFVLLWRDENISDESWNVTYLVRKCLRCLPEGDSL